MLRWASDIPDGSEIDADLAIVGAGAAGITLARALLDAGLRIVILEGGGAEYDDAVQDLYRGRIAGLPTEPLHVSRLRFFGGTTNHWAGWCRPLEPADFEGPHAWPFAHDALARYYRQAAAVCELGPPRFDDLAFWQEQSGAPGLEALDTGAEKLATAIFQISPPTQFADAYGDELRQADSVDLILGANALSLVPAAGTAPGQERKRIAGVRAAGLDGRRLTVTARAVVVAMGGLETPRLLLHSTDVFPAGAGNERDLVGRYFQDHPWLPRAAYLSFAEPGTDLPLYFAEHDIAGARLFGALASTPAVREREDIGGFRLVLQAARRSQLGMDSARRVADAIGDGAVPDDLWEHLGAIFGDFDQIADKGYRAAFGGRDSPFLEPVKPDDPTVGAMIDLNTEQEPNRESRVRLDDSPDAVDALGQRRLVLDWQLTERDARTAARALGLLAEEAGRLGLGRLRLLEAAADLPERWPDDLTGSRHHMSTARMAETPGEGVTDADGRVHSTENLYVCGSALFPSSGYANPTLTIVALALRQAEHLRRRLRQTGG